MLYHRLTNEHLIKGNPIRVALASTIVLLIAVAFGGHLVGCSDDNGWSFDVPQADLSQIDITLDPAHPDFTVILEQVETSVGPLTGDFSVIVRNVRYYGLDLIVADFRVAQAMGTYYAPVTMTFNQIFPDTVTMYNPPEGELTWPIPLKNDNGVWGSGNITETLTVAFHAGRGNTIRVLAEIGVAPGPPAGVIAGLAYHDQNANGVQEPGENGLSAIGLELASTDGTHSLSGYTDINGRYRFEKLAIGDYTVSLVPADHVNPTTLAQHAVTIGDNPNGYDQRENKNFGIGLLPVPSLTIQVNADATVQSENILFEPYNFGADPYLRVGTTLRDEGPNDALRSLVRFDLPYEMGAVVAARLEMTIVTFPRGTDQTYQLAVHGITESGDRTPWVEGNGSFWYPDNSNVLRPEVASGVAWAGDGYNLAQPDFDPSPLSSVTVVQADHSLGDVIAWDVTGLVNDWLAGSVPNYGFVVRDTKLEGGHRVVQFSARDAALWYDGKPVTALDPPRLVLIYE